MPTTIMQSATRSGKCTLPRRAVAGPRGVAARAVPERSSSVKAGPRKILEAGSKFAGACALAVVLATSAVEPAEAAKSGGRAGGSAGFSSARTQSRAPAPSRQAPRQAPPVTNNYYSSGPGFGFSPFGFSPFGFSPFGFGGGAVVVGAPAAGFSFFSLILDVFLIGAFFTLVSSLFSAFNKKDNKKDDDGW